MATPAATETTAVLGVDQLGGLAQHALDVDRLDRDQHHVGAAHELGVVGDVLHAQALGQARRAPRAAIRDEDALGERRVGAQPALDHRAGHVAGADRAQDGGRVHASDGTCGRLAGTQARGWLSAVYAHAVDVRATRRPGGCLCGAVRYEVRGPLRDVIVCHCVECRRSHGTSGAYTSVARDDVEVSDPEGELSWFWGPQSATRGRARVLPALRVEPLLAHAGARHGLDHRWHARRGDRIAHGPAHLGRAAGRLGGRRRASAAHAARHRGAARGRFCPLSCACRPAMSTMFQCSAILPPSSACIVRTYVRYCARDDRPRA